MLSLLLLPLLASSAPVAAPPAATVKAGKLAGAWDGGGAVASFRDVPFAQALRFTPPQTAVPWSGVRDASAFGPGCAQRNSSHNPDVPTLKAEDCTRLNVFAPRAAFDATASAAARVPVMVWWHGGAFTEGSSFGPYDLYDGGNVAHAGNVVVVSCNYRLGALGALVHAGGLGGNYGFLDQRACLQWVQDEIHNFGGDAGNVTIWGQSAGAQSGWFHMTSPGSRGLFHRAILESAPDLSLFEAKDAAKLGAEVAKLLNCTTGSSADVIACLRAADLGAVISAASKAEGAVGTILGTLSLKHPTASFLPFKPNIDGVEFTDQPFNTLLTNSSGTVPTLLGFNHDEMWALMSKLPKWVKGLEVEAGLVALFGLKAGPAAWKYYSKLYPGDVTSAVVKILTDYVFTCAGQRAALALPTTYVYQNNHFDSFAPTLFTKFGIPQCATDGRVCHMAEIPFVFGNHPTAPGLNVSFTAAENQLTTRLIAAFTTFAKTGSPNVTGWQPYTAAARNGLTIGNGSSLVTGPLGAAASVCVDIWDKAGYLH